jgi:ABC-type uncharacterized transport system substrate-binding protein
MTCALFEAESRDVLEHFVNSARQQGILVKYLPEQHKKPKYSPLQIKEMQERVNSLYGNGYQNKEFGISEVKELLKNDVW